MTSTATIARTEAPPRPRPSTQYWDHRVAGWLVAIPSPIPAPRRGR